MTNDNSVSLINLGKLSKPADTLIKKVSSAVGGICEPYQIKRIAKAETEANLIKAKSEIEITDLHHRAMHRFVEEEASRQENMETITEKALPLLDEEADPSLMEDDWVTNFFDKSRIISDNEMQSIWSNVLAGEANSPGTFSKRTVNFLGDLDKRDAELFQNLCSFGWHIDCFTPLIFNSQNKLYNDQGLNFDTLAHLDSIGLIKFNNLIIYIRTELPKKFEASYHEHSISLKMNKDKDNELPIGTAILTQIGIELATVCKAPRVEGFREYVKEQWKAYLTKENETEQSDSNAA